MPASAEELVELLDLESLDVDLFRGRQPETDRQRVFGGQVAAQALIAGVRTTEDDLHVHSLHSYFLRPGRHGGADHLRRRAAARRTLVLDPADRGPPARPPDLLHDRQLPARRGRLRAPGRDARRVGGPEAGIDFADLAQRARRRPRRASCRSGRPSTSATSATQPTWGHNLTDDPSRPARAQLWIRVNGRLSDDPRRAPRDVHLRQRHDAARRHPRAATASRSATRGSSRPRSTTPSGSTGPSAPTSGGSTTSGRPPPRAPAASPWPGSSPRTAPSSPPWPRRA